MSCNDGYLYKQAIASDEKVMLLTEGDIIKIEYYDTTIEGIRQITSWEFSNDTGDTNG